MKELPPWKEIYNLPNALTTLRLLCIPLVIFWLTFPGRWGGFLSALFFSLAFITDFLDGFFARKYGTITDFGKFFDPLADKILVSLTMIMLTLMDRVPFWVVMLIIAREMAVTGLRGVALREGIVIQASKLGKYKTIFQAVSLIGLCLHYEYLNVDFHSVGTFFLWIALIMTLWSGGDYFYQFSRGLFTKKNG